MVSMLVLLALAVLAVPVLLVVLLVGLGNLKRRVDELEAELARVVAGQRRQERESAPVPVAARAESAAVPRPARVPVRRPPRAAPTPGPLDRVAGAVRRWFTEGNVPVKVGVLVLLAGVAALLKYAGDQGWLSVPMSVRLAGTAAVALAALAFAWRKRASHRSFSLAVQGGAIGVLLLVVFAAFKRFDLLPAGPAFAISIALVTALGVLAVLQDSRTLAVLGILAGFMAPIWLSTGSGSHVVLFSYYALLNAAVFAIAWLRPWRELNLLGWAFTWGIGLAWGVLAYRTDQYATAQGFLLLFFAFYLLIPILYARRRAPGRRDIVDGGLLFGTPLVAFLLQAGLLEGARAPLALCAAGLAAIYGVLAWWQRRGPHRVLGEAYVLLAVGFVTLAVPLAFSASATAAVFAMEGAALVWLGLRQERPLSRWAGAGLQAAAAVAFFFATAALARPEPAIANPAFLGALLIALAGFASAWCWHASGRPGPAAAFYGWGLAWWGGNALAEIAARVDAALHADALLAVTAVTTLLAAGVHRRRPAPLLALTVLAGFAFAALLAFAQGAVDGQPLADRGGVAWMLFAACGLRALVDLREGGGRIAPWAQFAWLLLWPLVLALAARGLALSAGLGRGWTLALPALPWLALLALLQVRWTLLRRPMDALADPLRTTLLSTCLLVVGLGWLVALRHPGDSAPLPWLPVLDPLDLVQLAALLLTARWLGSPLAPPAVAERRMPLLAAAAFLLATCITLRSVHHWGGVAWGGVLWSSSLAQMALTVVWSVLGVAGWIAGSRRGQRGLWLAGAVLMAVVLGKLVLVDRQHLGNLLGIGSFMAYGLLCTLVGWFAPAPPRTTGEPIAHPA